MRGVWKKSFCVGLLFCMFCLEGCAATELEERCFPMMAAVGYEEDNGYISYIVGFPINKEKSTVDVLMGIYESTQVRESTFKESKEKYENRLNKVPDYNHLKVLVFEEELVEEKKVYDEVLDYIIEKEEFPRNTYVCIVEDMDDLMDLEENISSDLGTYLEEYLNKWEEEGKKIVTLGDLIDEKENNILEIAIPVLEVVDHFVEWERNHILGE